MLSPQNTGLKSCHISFSFDFVSKQPVPSGGLILNKPPLSRCLNRAFTVFSQSAEGIIRELRRRLS